MKHLGIFITGAFSFAGLGTADLLYFSRFLGLKNEKATEKFCYKNFLNICSYVGRKPQGLFIVTENKNIFIYVRSNNVFLL
jgi:hypothetical protein